MLESTEILLRKTLLVVGIATCVSIISQTTRASERDVSAQDLRTSLAQLDDMFDQRDTYLVNRKNIIRTLKRKAERRPSAANLAAIAKSYTGVDNDSALAYYERAIEAAPKGSGERSLLEAQSAVLMPLAGLVYRSQQRFENADTTVMTPAQKIEYYDAGHLLYANITAFYSQNVDVAIPYSQKVLEYQKKLLNALRDQSESPLYRLVLGEYLLRTGHMDQAETTLREVYNILPDGDRQRTQAAHVLSHILAARGDKDAELFYLVNSVRGDLANGNVELPSLQDLGLALHKREDEDRAFRYLNIAIADASAAKTWIRILQSSNTFPMVQQAHADRLKAKHTTLMWVIVALAIALVALAAGLIYLRRETKELRQARRSLAEANHTKEIYLCEFMQLCSAYLERLSQYGVMINSKISAGKTEDVVRILKSGKFVADQSTHFFEVFDNAFLHLYPDFVERVNSLLRPDSQIELREGERLNTDLRILAFMRMGMDDSATIAQILNYSVNTIYAYRNKLKQRAIDRANFERNIMSIPSLGE